MASEVTGLARKNKYKKKALDRENASLNINLDGSLLEMYANYAISENGNIHFSMINNLYRLLLMVSDAPISMNERSIALKKFTISVLRAKIEKHVLNKQALLSIGLNETGIRPDLLNAESFKELGDGEVQWVEETILNYVNLSTVNNTVRKMQDICQDYITSDPTEKIAKAKEVQSINDELHTQFRRNAMNLDNQDDRFTLSDMNQSVDRTIAEMNKPSYSLVTGIQAFNDILGGGAKGGKCYCLFGLPGEGKTVTLLNLLYQMKVSNKSYVCRDKTKRPALVLLTMENKVSDIIATLFSIVTGNGDIAEYTAEDAIKIMNSKGLGVSPDNPIEIIVRYKPVNSITTSYCYTLIEDLKDEGCETIGFFLDYVMRIKPEQWDSEERFRLGNVTNELCNLAKYYDIPVITASQLNRNAASIIDECRDSNKMNIVRKMGRSLIGESIQIDQNVDASIFLAPEYTTGPNGEDIKWMGIKLGKHRYPIFTEQTVFYIPFMSGSQVGFEMDLGGRRKTKKSLNFNEEIDWTKEAKHVYTFGGGVTKHIINEDPKDIILGGDIRNNTDHSEILKRTEDYEAMAAFWPKENGKLKIMRVINDHLPWEKMTA